MPLSHTRWLTPAALILLVPLPGAAQGIPFSQRASVAQTVAFTQISIAYGRPTARGRKIFGDSGIVKWDRLWHPGADSATRITFDHDVTFEGKPLAAGEYSLWTIPRESGRWTVIVSRAAHVFHTPYPGEGSDVMRVEVQVEQGPHMESLAYYFPAVLRDTATLRLHWGEVMLPLHLTAPFRPS
ncbi:MAG: DUF2911 domain-containing protein [Gemmatimonadota bacterium]